MHSVTHVWYHRYFWNFPRENSKWNFVWNKMEINVIRFEMPKQTWTKKKPSELRFFNKNWVDCKKFLFKRQNTTFIFYSWYLCACSRSFCLVYAICCNKKILYPTAIIICVMNINCAIYYFISLPWPIGSSAQNKDISKAIP